MNGLRGAGIVVTRPAERGQSLCRLVAAEGGEALSFPTIDIEPLPVTAGSELADWLVFTSVNSVHHGLAAAKGRRGPATRVAAIGDATATALEEAGWNVDVTPADRQESEALLEAAELADVAGQHVLLVKGEGGRGLLQASLAERGATVESLDVYRRLRPDTSPAPLLDRWERDRIDAIVVTSRSGLENLAAMLDEQGRGYLATTTVVAPTARMIKLIRELGINAEPVIAGGASDEAMMAALLDWWRSHPNRRQQDSE